jgi:hypothetical protein
MTDASCTKFLDCDNMMSCELTTASPTSYTQEITYISDQA